MESVQDVRGRQRHHTGAMGAPTPIQKDSTFAAQACMDVGAAKMRSHDPIRARGIAYAHMRDQSLGESVALLGTNDHLPGPFPDDVGYR